MSEAVYVLLGVLLGAAIPAVVALYTARQTDKRAREAAQDARDARLYDDRRAVYLAFVEKVHAFADATATHSLLGGPDPDEDTLEPLVKRLSAVQLFAPRDSYDSAWKAFEALRDYMFESTGTGQQVEDALEDFAVKARRDLGVSDRTPLAR